MLISYLGRVARYTRVKHNHPAICIPVRNSLTDGQLDKGDAFCHFTAHAKTYWRRNSAPCISLRCSDLPTIRVPGIMTLYNPCVPVYQGQHFTLNVGIADLICFGRVAAVIVFLDMVASAHPSSNALVTSSSRVSRPLCLDMRPGRYRTRCAQRYICCG